MLLPKEGLKKNKACPKRNPCLPSSSLCLISRGRTDSWLINRYGVSVGKMLKYFHVRCKIMMPPRVLLALVDCPSLQDILMIRIFVRGMMNE